MAIIGGRLGYSLLRLISPSGRRSGCPEGDAYQHKSKLDVFYPSGFWDDVQNKTVVDFGCGSGTEAVEMAKRGAGHVVGIDIRQSVIDAAIGRATEEGVADRCTFTKEYSNGSA